jgi:hypothetical protein
MRLNIHNVLFTLATLSSLPEGLGKAVPESPSVGVDREDMPCYATIALYRRKLTNKSLQEHQ